MRRALLFTIQNYSTLALFPPLLQALFSVWHEMLEPHYP